jgi:hypothetical protein
MNRLRKIGAYAALTNALAGIATLVVVFGLIGLPALLDNQKLVELAMNNKTPFIIQDILKLISAFCMMILIVALLGRLKNNAPKPMTVATASGAFGILCLLANTFLSLFLITSAEKFARLNSQSIMQINTAIIVLAMAAIFFNGLWYLIVNWVGLKHRRLPKYSCYLGLAAGLLGLIPPLGIFFLVLSIGWLIWLSMTFSEETKRPQQQELL